MKATARAIALSVAALGALGAPVVRAQTAPVPPRVQPGSTPPPVLSTVPSLPAGAVPEPGQMSGLPLQVGDLPPGIVSARVIRRTFAENVADQAIELRTGTGRVLKAVTNKEGRAQFGPLTIGETVRVRAAVDGELLESQPFELPAQGGVRLVLVAGVGAGSPGGEGVQPVAAAPAVGAAEALQPTATPVIERIGAGPIVLFLLAIAGAVTLWWRQPRQVAAQPVRRADFVRVEQQRRQTLATPGRRAEVFETLVRLEKDFEARRVDKAVYETRRQELIAELVSLDLALSPSGKALLL